MLPKADYHMHTPLCGHAVGTPEEYVRRALEVGLLEMGFSDHAPFVHIVDPRVTMNSAQLPEYYRMIEDARERFKDKIKILIGIEADFIPGYEPKTKEILDNYPFDYVLGSVHFIKDWGFDNPDEREKWNEADVNSVYRDYYDLLRKSARSGLFDIISHCDLVKKFGHRATEDMTSEIEKNARVFKETGMAIEINTSGLRKPCAEMYPALSCLEIYAAHGIPLTFGSDAHEPQHVGHNFEEAVEMARAAGFEEYVLFRKRKISDRVRLK